MRGFLRGFAGQEPCENTIDDADHEFRDSGKEEGVLPDRLSGSVEAGALGRAKWVAQKLLGPE